MTADGPASASTRGGPSVGGRRALVAGATGLVGRALLDDLLASADTPPRDLPPYAGVLALRRGTSPVPPSTDPRLSWLSVDFGTLPVLPPVDDVYIALGTTIRQAGSQAAFRAVDFDAVLAVARAARVAGAGRLGVVSALGADPQSRVFYNRVKGEMEAAVAALGYTTVVIAQPSLLDGDRTRLGQPSRTGEQWGLALLRPLARLLPRGMRPIAAKAVAHGLRQAVQAGTPGVRRLSSGELQP